MKGILEFNLPEDREEFKMCQEGGSYHSALFEFDQWVYRVNKHNENIPEKYLEMVVQAWRQAIDGIEL